MDLPSRKVQRLRLNIVPDGAEFVDHLSGPFHGKFLLETNDGRCFLIRLRQEGRCEIVRKVDASETSLSPDAKAIAFVDASDAKVDLGKVCIQNLASGSTRTLGRHVISIPPTWSLDGKYVTAVVETPPAQVPWGDTDGYNRSSKQWVITAFSLDGKHVQPLAIGRRAVWLTSNALLVGNHGEHTFTSNLKDLTPHQTKDYESAFACPQIGLFLADVDEDEFDAKAPSFGIRQHDLVEATPQAIRYGTADGAFQVSLAIVNPANSAWDAPSGFAVSFGPERINP